MKDCLEFIVNSIIDSKKTKIFQEDTSPGQAVLIIESEKENLGKIIGKKGKIIDSIRRLIRIRAAKEGKKVLINIKELD